MRRGRKGAVSPSVSSLRDPTRSVGGAAQRRAHRPGTSPIAAKSPGARGGRLVAARATSGRRATRRLKDGTGRRSTEGHREREARGCCSRSGKPKSRLSLSSVSCEESAASRRAPKVGGAAGIWRVLRARRPEGEGEGEREREERKGRRMTEQRHSRNMSHRSREQQSTRILYICTSYIQ